MSELIDKALADCGDTDVVVMGRNVLEETGRVFKELFGDAKVIIIADENTWAVAGEQTKASLEGAGVETVEPMIFPGRPAVYACYANVEKIRDHMRDLDGVIACSIGSGTLNDITKRASDELGRRYMNVCTAASMDGYAAFGASITENGFKHTMSCRAPQALIADLPTMAGAPQRCTATGLGDLIEKVPAGADWIVADELGIEPIDDEVWDLVQGPLTSAISDPEGLANGKPEAFDGLIEGLVMSGLAMQKYRISSRPASGAGHQFSHLWEMEHLGMDQDPPTDPRVQGGTRHDLSARSVGENAQPRFQHPRRRRRCRQVAVGRGNGGQGSRQLHGRHARACCQADHGQVPRRRCAARASGTRQVNVADRPRTLPLPGHAGCQGRGDHQDCWWHLPPGADRPDSGALPRHLLPVPADSVALHPS